MNKKLIITLGILIMFLGASFTSVIGYKIDNKTFFTTSAHILIETNNAGYYAQNLLSEGFDILKGKTTNNTFELIVSPTEFKILSERGFLITILEIGRPFRDIQNELHAGSDDPPPGYKDLSAILTEMNDTASSYPSIAMVVDLTSEYGTPPTYEGRHIYAMKISDSVFYDQDEPTFLMVSCHHARELVTPEIALYAIDQFTSNYGIDPDITDFVNNYEIWICPVWNPDGYEYVFNVNNMWRKNRHPYYGTFGVDLNRNYPFGWDSGCGGSTSPTSETYRGPFAASEEETQTMIAFTNDQHFAKVIDYHSYGREVLYSYCCHTHPFTSYMQSEATSISTAAGYGGDIRPPSAEGEHYEWQIFSNGSYSNLMETHSDFQPTYASAQAEAAQVWPATEYILGVEIPLQGHVIDSVTGNPVVADITLVGITFSNDEEFRSEPDYGRYHMFMPSGNYNVKFEAQYYQSKTESVTISSGNSYILNVELVRENDPPYQPEINGDVVSRVGLDYYLEVSVDDPQNDDFFVFIEWDDGTPGDWLGPYSAGVPITITHVFTDVGEFELRAKAKDLYNEESEWSESIFVIVSENIVPSDPQIDGPSKGSSGQYLQFNFVSTDAEEDDIYYYIEWGDGTFEEWLGPYTSGEILSVPHKWDSRGNYEIKAMARDELGAESNWGTFTLRIPRNKVVFNNILLNILEKFPSIRAFFLVLEDL
jgi:hypothetical protein